ncbi:MAG: hypothetical protein K9J13_09720 [Saprospiraceae bacterium]|nr:hypothetical protein [Saprospiraceae bacterium]
MKRKLLIAFAFILPFISIAQDNKFGINWSGFVKADYFFDSRQTVSVREGHFLLYPANEKLDKEGNDINATPNMNMLAIQTRLTGKITGPDAFGAKTSGVIEGAFFGHSDGDVNGFRLRHAFAKLNWEKTELLFGQTWHPMFVTDCFPGVISFNTGVPFQPFSRNPQVRLTRKLGDNLKVVAALQSQRDFASPGGSTSLRNSAIPDMQLQIHFKNEKIAAGLGGGYKILTPRLITDSGYAAVYGTAGTVKGISGSAWFKYTAEKFTFKTQATYGENLYDVLMLGGYAIDTLNQAYITSRDVREYTTMDVLGAWAECHTNGKKLQIGVFGGYTKNMASKNNIYDWTSSSSYSARGIDIAYVYRVAPRFVFISGKTKFATEIEYTVAGYGSTRNSLGEIQDKSDEFPTAEIKDVANVRLLFSVIYAF